MKEKSTEYGPQSPSIKVKNRKPIVKSNERCGIGRDENCLEHVLGVSVDRSG